MSLLSSKGVYGLNAMYELIGSTKENPMQSRDISKNTNIPQNYLEQLLGKLKKAGLIASIRGSKGGYHLCLDKKEIQVKDILSALEGGIKLHDTETLNPYLNIFYKEVQTKLEALFELNLEELNKYQEKYNEFLHYSI